MAYGEISLRQAGDIDLLINRRDFDAGTTAARIARLRNDAAS